jgi:hypothetical protein
MTKKSYIVTVDLDEMVGEFHTEKSARIVLERILTDRISHYNPVVSLAPDSLQPVNNAWIVDPDRLIFSSYSVAADALRDILSVIRKDGLATIREYYDFIGVQSTNFSDNYWGWTSSKDCTIRVLNDGRFQIVLPTPTHLTEKGK